MMKTTILALALAASVWSAEPFVIHGHRGAPAILPENTLPSFEEAIRAGADFIELDVYATRDNVLVITHDPAINLEICQGPGGKRPIRELTLEQVRQYDCGSLKPKTFPQQKAVPGTRIPTLDEVLDLAKSSNVRFNIEIKSNEKWKDLTPSPDEISRMVAETVRKHKLERRAMVQSFDFRVVKAMRAVAPSLTVAALYGAPGDRSFVDIARETRAQIVTPNFQLVTPEKVKAAHDAGIQVIPWTVDTPDGWDRLIEAGVDGIITNDPGALAAHLKKKGRR
jgi:glycerophosphoryl diester phosphodiesterase